MPSGPLDEVKMRKTIVLLPKSIWSNKTKMIVDWLKGRDASPHEVHDGGSDSYYILLEPALFPEFKEAFPRLNGGSVPQYFSTKLIH